MYRLDVAPLQKLGQRRGDIEFAALRQTRQVGDRAPAIQQQEHPAFPARELASKRRCLQVGNNTEYWRCVESSLLRAKFRHHTSPSYTRWRRSTPSTRPACLRARTLCPIQ